MTDQPDLATRLAPLADRYSALAAQRARIDAELDEIKAAMLAAAPDPDKYAAGEHTITITPNQRFDEKKALGLIPEELAPLVTYPETKVNKELLRGLAPEIYEAAQTTYTHRISVK